MPDGFRLQKFEYYFRDSDAQYYIGVRITVTNAISGADPDLVKKVEEWLGVKPYEGLTVDFYSTFANSNKFIITNNTSSQSGRSVDKAIENMHNLRSAAILYTSAVNKIAAKLEQQQQNSLSDQQHELRLEIGHTQNYTEQSSRDGEPIISDSSLESPIKSFKSFVSAQEFCSFFGLTLTTVSSLDWLINVKNIMLDHAGLFQGVGMSTDLTFYHHANHLQMLKTAVCLIFSSLGLYTAGTAKTVKHYLDNYEETYELQDNKDNYLGNIVFDPASLDDDGIFPMSCGLERNVDKLMSYVHIEGDEDEENEDEEGDMQVSTDLLLPFLLTAKATMQGLTSFKFQTVDGSVKVLQAEVENAMVHYYNTDYNTDASYNSRRGLAIALNEQQLAVEIAEDLGDDEAPGQVRQTRRGEILSYCMSNLITSGVYDDYDGPDGAKKRVFMQVTKQRCNGILQVSKQPRGFTGLQAHWKKYILTESIKRANTKAREEGYIISHIELVIVLVDHIQEECGDAWDFKRHLTAAGMTKEACDEMAIKVNDLNNRRNR